MKHVLSLCTHELMLMFAPCPFSHWQKCCYAHMCTYAAKGWFLYAHNNITTVIKSVWSLHCKLSGFSVLSIQLYFLYLFTYFPYTKLILSRCIKARKSKITTTTKAKHFFSLILGDTSKKQIVTRKILVAKANWGEYRDLT